MRCPNCGFDTPAGAPRCPNCGYFLASGEAKTSGLAIAAFVCGLLGCLGVTGIAGIILGLIALSQISRSQGGLKGSWMAGVGLAAAILEMVMVLPALVLAPVFMQAREQSKGAMCLSNESQLCRATIMYANDNSNTLPPRTAWCDLTEPYLRAKLVYHCPSTPEGDFGYTMNSRMSGKKQPKLKWPAETVLLFDGGPKWNAFGGFADVKPRHRDKAMVLFMDGQVRKQTLAELEAKRWTP